MFSIELLALAPDDWNENGDRDVEEKLLFVLLLFRIDNGVFNFWLLDDFGVAEREWAGDKQFDGDIGEWDAGELDGDLVSSIDRLLRFSTWSGDCSMSFWADE